jgi:hypothetical protein
VKKFEITYHLEGQKNTVRVCMYRGVNHLDALARLVKHYRVQGAKIQTIQVKEL